MVWCLTTTTRRRHLSSPHCMSHKIWNRYFTKCQQTNWKLRLRKVKGPIQGHWARTGNTWNPIWYTDHIPWKNSHSIAFSSSKTPSVIRMSSLPLSVKKSRGERFGLGSAVSNKHPGFGTHPTLKSLKNANNFFHNMPQYDLSSESHDMTCFLSWAVITWSLHVIAT